MEMEVMVMEVMVMEVMVMEVMVMEVMVMEVIPPNLLTRNPVEVENKIAPKLMLKKTKIKDVIIPNMCV
jgi:hypothetical protein